MVAIRMSAKKSAKKRQQIPKRRTFNSSATVAIATHAAFDRAFRKKRYLEALNIAEQLVDANPQNPSAWESLANTLGRLDRINEAAEAMQNALLRMKAEDQNASLKHAQYVLLAGRADEAASALEILLDQHPKNIMALVWLSRAYLALGKNKEALEKSDIALEIDENFIEALIWRSRILDKLKRPSEAASNLNKIKRLEPKRVGVNNHLADIALREGDYKSAEALFKEELSIDPTNSQVLSNVYVARHYNPDYSLEDLSRLAVEWQQKHAKNSPVGRAKTQPKPGKRLKIGLLSGGFRMHPVGQMIFPALKHLDPHKFELVVYSTHQASDKLTEKIKSVTHFWNNISGLNPEELNQKIRDDHIDILIDMNGAGDGSRYLAISKEPAPLIIKWVGSLINTTGLSCIDYLLTDSIETPEGVDELYTEKLIRMPDDYICYHIPEHAPKVTGLPALKNGHITFGCLNNPAKLSQPLLKEWAALLKEIPDSKLLLRGVQFEGEAFCEKITNIFASHGIESDRLILEGPADHHNFMATYQRIDIALDTWPYSGGLTTCEALLMGVPVVTHTGPTFAGRHTATHLANAGLPELITDNWDDFRRRAKELAGDLPNLAVIRAALRTILSESPVCDGPRFSKNLTVALRAIWQRHCEGKVPEALTMDKEGLVQFEDEDEPVVLGSDEKTSDQVADWFLDEPVIVVDNAALMHKHPRFRELLQSGNVAIMSFDPGSQYTKQTEELKVLGELHYHPHALLGDGSQQTLYVTLNPKKTGTLKPLSSHELPERRRHDLQLLTELPIDSLRLDDIQGLPSVDILLLDDVNDAMAVLENGSDYLKDTLAIQVNVSFQSTHEKQCNLGQFQNWAKKNGFQFYTLKNLEYHNYATGETCDHHSEVGELVSGEALFLPSRERLEGLHENDKKKLAFYLDAACQMKGMAGAILKMSIERNRLSYDRKNIVAKVRKSKKRFIHICFNNMHVQPLVDILGDGRSIEGYDNTIYIGRNRSIPGYDVDISCNSQALFFDVEAQLSKVISDCLDNDVVGVFFHGMFFPWQKRIAKEISSNKKLCWVIWGGDIYRQKKHDSEMLQIVDSIDCIATVTSSDYYIYQKVFGNKPHFQFSYKLPFDNADIERPLKKEKLIIVGNSGDPENRHADVIRELSKKKDILNYKIIIPFSYNASSDYLRKVKDYVEKCGLSDNTEFLTDFIDKENYFSLISRAEVLVTAHERSQAGATINAAIFYGTNVVLKKYIAYDGAQIKNPMWTRIEDMKIEVVDYLGFKQISRLSALSVKNKESVIMDRKGLISSRGEEKVKENLENLMSYMCGGVEK